MTTIINLDVQRENVNRAVGAANIALDPETGYVTGRADQDGRVVLDVQFTVPLSPRELGAQITSIRDEVMIQTRRIPGFPAVIYNTRQA